MKRTLMTPFLVALSVALSLFITPVMAAPPQPQSKGPSSYVYPFPDYPNPRTNMLAPQSDRSVFLADASWPSDGRTSATSHLWGTVVYGAASLHVADDQGSWDTSWELCPVDETNWTPWPASSLLLNALPKDVYEVRLRTPASPKPSPTFWVAWPTNAILPDRFPPTGAVHGEIVKERSRLRLHVWGYAYDAIQAGLRGSNGVQRARLKIDGNWSDIVLDAAGSFDASFTVPRRGDGVHTVALYANDFAHASLTQLDAEYVSENGWPLPQAPNPDPNGHGLWVRMRNLPLFYPDGIAVAKPRLDAKGLLVFDGSESIGAHVYRWRIVSIPGGTEYSKDGAIVATEDIPTGFYLVTLDCAANHIIYEDAESAPEDHAATFCIVIPPRVSLASREVDGAVHIRWTPETVAGVWNWCFYLSGHVFDEIGTAIYNQSVSNLEGWVTVNGERLNLKLDQSGAFLTHYVAGVRPADVYDIVLTVRTLDDGREYEADRLHETRLTIFPPWLHCYFR